MLRPYTQSKQFSKKYNETSILRAVFIVIYLVFSVILTGFGIWPAGNMAFAQDAVKTAEITQEAAVSPPDAAYPEGKKREVEPKPAAAPETKIINTTLIAEIDTTITVTLDGQTLESTEVHRTEKGALYVNAMPIFSALNNDVEYDDVSKALIVRRSQDNVVMELYTETGIVKANGKALGKLRHFGEIKDGRYLLTPNAIAVMSGANGRFDQDSKTFNFKLDPRLKVATGFDIIVNGLSLGNLNPEPKSVGPVLILPLLPIAEALGHDVTVLDASQDVRVRRAQDSAEFELNLETGLVKLRGVPYGITKDVTYIDATNLLLPVNAIETLTGTNIRVEGGTSRILVDLDERLSGAIKPGELVDDVAAKEPFTPETLSFHIGLDTINRVDADFRVKKLNGRVRYETPDLPRNGAELQPSWLSLDFAHVNGVTGTIGDYSADHRELDGVGLRRIRGVSAVKETKKGRWALAAGAPTNGARQISEDQSRLTFGGVAAGARFQSREGWEAGLSYKKDSLSSDQMAVLSAISGHLGREKDKKIQWDARGDLGYFNGPARENSLDIRASVSGRYDLTPSLTFDANASYEGAEFLRSRLTAETLAEQISGTFNPDDLQDEEDFQLVPDTRRLGIDQFTIGTSIRLTPNKTLGLLNNPAASIRAQKTVSGFVKGTSQQVTIDSIGASVATSLADTGVSISADINAFAQTFADDAEKVTGRGFSARAYKQFESVTVRAQYLNSVRGDQKKRESAALTATTRSFNVPLGKEAGLSVAPSATALWTPEATSLRAGVIANFNSGQLLGQKTRLEASLGVLQSIGSGGGNNNAPSNQTDKFLNITLARRMRIGKNMALGLSYRNNLEGDQRFGLQLDGRFDFNEKRKYKQTLDGRGVLKGRAFIDENRDGIKQENEVAVPNALVRLKGTRMALRTDKGGFFTIQNIKVGLYDVQIDGRSLPLGYSMAMEGQTRVSIHDGRISDVPMPIVQRGQIRGFTFIDENANGQYEKGEERIDGASLRLNGDSLDEEARAISTSFGQYAFDDLVGGLYEITVLDQPKLGLKAGKPIAIDLDAHDRLMARIAVPVLRTAPSDTQVAKTPVKTASMPRAPPQIKKEQDGLAADHPAANPIESAASTNEGKAPKIATNTSEPAP